MDNIASAASLRHLQQTFGPATPTNAWKFMMASITYFQDTPGGTLEMVPNLIDFTRHIWDSKQQSPGALYPGSIQIANRLGTDFQITPATPNWLEILERHLSTYFRFRAWIEGRRSSRVTGRRLPAQQRNNWVGDGFEQVLYLLTKEYLDSANIPGLEVKFKLRPEDIIGFQLRTGGGRQRFPVSDIAIANPSLTAVISAKVGLRVDRTRGELDAAMTLARIRPEVRYLIVTSEYDTGFLKLLVSEPAIARVYHINKSYLSDFWSAVPGGAVELPWIAVSIADLSQYFADISILGQQAV